MSLIQTPATLTLKQPVNLHQPATEYENCSAADLDELITLYLRCDDIVSRRSLTDCIDRATDLLQKEPVSESTMHLAATLLEASRKQQIYMPAWLPDYLAIAIAVNRQDPAVPETSLAVPLLTLHLVSGNQQHEDEATAIIRRAAARCSAGHATPADHDIVSLCSEYV